MSTPEVKAALSGMVTADPHSYCLNGTKITVRNSRLLVYMPSREPTAERLTAGGVIIPDGDGFTGEGEDIEEALILAVGEGRYNGETGSFLGCDYEVGQWVWIVTVGTNEHFIDKVPRSETIVLIQDALVRAIVDGPRLPTQAGIPNEREFAAAYAAETDEG